MDPTLALESRPLNTTNNRLFLPDIRSRVLTSFVYFIHISSVQFSRSISIAQLSRMSHCAPEATLNPIRLKFTPETVVSNVVVAQVCCAGRLFQTRDPAAAKLLSPNQMCCVRVERRTICRRTSGASDPQTFVQHPRLPLLITLSPNRTTPLRQTLA